MMDALGKLMSYRNTFLLEYRFSNKKLGTRAHIIGIY